MNVIHRLTGRPRPCHSPARDTTTRGGYGLLIDALVVTSWEALGEPITWKSTTNGLVLDTPDWRAARDLLVEGADRWRPCIWRAVRDMLALRQQAYRALKTAWLPVERADGAIARAEAESKFKRMLRRWNKQIGERSSVYREEQTD